LAHALIGMLTLYHFKLTYHQIDRQWTTRINALITILIGTTASVMALLFLISLLFSS